jgi:hypothetical protein
MHKRNIGLTIATAIVLAASSHLALGSERTKTYGLPSCIQLPDGKKTMCLTCPDGPCVIKTGSGDRTVSRVPDTIDAGSAMSGRLRANSPKPAISANHPVGNENKRN